MQVNHTNGFRRRIGWLAALSVLVLVSSALLWPDRSLGEERKFIVMLAHSPKQEGSFDNGFGEGGESTNDVNLAYFGEDQISFKRFWEEVSYNDVTIDGSMFPFMYLPWPLEPPSDVLDEGNANGLYVNGTIPYLDLDRSRHFNYGEGEEFFEYEQMFEVDLDGNYNGTDENGNPSSDEFEGEDEDYYLAFGGLVDGVWTPGERFRDSDGDGRWDFAETSPDEDGHCPLGPDGEPDPFYDPTTVSLVVVPPGEVVEEGDYCDSDFDESYDPGEPWEDFLVRYDATQPEGLRWVLVTEDYINKNYPGDVDGLIARMGNFTWDGPDGWSEAFGEEQAENLTPEGTTKLLLAGRSVIQGKSTPRPLWLTAMWVDRYGTLPPAWRDPVRLGESIPEIIPFNPTEPDPAIDRVDPPAEEILRQFVPGTYDKEDKYTEQAYNADLATLPEGAEEPQVFLSPRDDDDTNAGTIEPDATGVYDGVVEFDDLASSVYHDPPDVQWRARYSNGDLRLGEVTSPEITETGDPNNPDDLDPPWGEDLTRNDPYYPVIGETPAEGIIWAAGPYAFRIHGDNLMDAGNQLSIELLTWRTDGQGAAVPKEDKVPLMSIWHPEHSDGAHPPGFYRETYLGSKEAFDNFDGGSGYSLEENCEDDDPFSFGDYGVRGLTYYNPGGVPGEGSYYLAKLGFFAGELASGISVMGEIVHPSADNLPPDCPHPVVNPRPIADTTLFEALSYELWSLGLDNIEAIEFDPTGTLYAINPDDGGGNDRLVIVPNPFDAEPDVQVFVLSSQATGIDNSDIYITGLAFHVDEGVLYGCDTGPFKMLFSISIEDGHQGEYSVAISNIADSTVGASHHFTGRIRGIAYRPDYFGDWVLPIYGIFDGGQGANPTAEIVALDPTTDPPKVYNPGTSFSWNAHQIHDLAFDDDAGGSRHFGVDVLDAGMYKFPISGTASPIVELTGVGVCFNPTDSDGDLIWDRRDEPFCDWNGNGRYDYAGFRDFNLDGLLDQGETIVPNGMNYLNDVDPNSTNNLVYGIYPFNRTRLLEDVVEVNDHERDWTDYVTGGQLDPNWDPMGNYWPNPVYGTVLVTPDAILEALGIREFSPWYAKTNTRDQGEPFDNLIFNDRGAVEFDCGESYTDSSGDGHYQEGEPFNDFGYDGVDGTNDTGEGNGILDGEPYIDINNNGKRDYGVSIDITSLVGGIGAYPDYKSRTTAHEYGHFWENYRDLYDIDSAGQPDIDMPGPVAGWDLMATGSMVHPAPMHKELPGSTCGGGIQHEPWINVIDLTTVLTPGVKQTVVVNSCELSRQNAYYAYRNMDRPAERFYFWRVSNDLLMPDGALTVNSRLPGKGLMIMHVDSTVCGSGACGSGLCQQQPDPWVYKLVQADGLFELQNGVNHGDEGDPFGNDSGVLDWLDERGDNEWNNGAVTGIEITDIQELATASLITFRWTPQDVPWFEFVRPPGGESSAHIYQIAYVASDRFGGTLTEFFIDGPYGANDPTPGEYQGTQMCCFLGPDDRPESTANCGAPGAVSQVPKVIGTFESSFPVDLSGLANGDYFFYAQLIPGEGQGGNFEQAASIGRPPGNAQGNANTGNGWLTGTDDPNPGDGPDNITPPVVDIDQSLLERWIVVCVDDSIPNAEVWAVTGSLSGPQEAPPPVTGQAYSSDDGVVSFRIVGGGEPFAAGDRFIFRTTGKTPFSARLRVKNGAVSIRPTAAFSASPLTGGAPLTVSFDGSESFDPESGGNGSLEFAWDFDDGTFGTDMITTHTYTQAGEYNVTLVVFSTISPYQSLNPNQTTIEVTANEPPFPCIEDVDEGTVVSQGDVISGATDETAEGFLLRVKPSACAGFSSIDPNGDPLKADWEFGDPYDDSCDPDCDGTPGDCTGLPIDQEVCHTYRAAGDYALTLTAIEDTSNAASGGVGVTVEVSGNSAPEAVITADPIGGPLNLAVDFDGSGSTDDDGIDQYDWYFGDGDECLNCGATESHTYTTLPAEPPGYFEAKLVVTDTLGVSGEATMQIFAGNSLPSNVSISTSPSPANVSEQQNITFQGDADDLDGDALDFLWDFDLNDGVDTDHPDATGTPVTRSYANEGNYTATLTVTDGKGPGVTDTVAVVVSRNDPPVARLKADPTSGGPPLTVNFDASGSSDREKPLAGLVFTWNFRDGTSLVTATGLAGATISHTFSAAAVYQVSVTVSDGVLSDQATVEITVRTPPPAAPTAALTAAPASGPSPLAVDFDAGGTIDPDDDLATFLWEFGDGSIALESLATVTRRTHTYNEPGTYTARLTAFDMQGQSSVAMVEISVGEGGAPEVVPPAGACGFGMVETLSFGLVGLSAMRLGTRRRRRTR